MRVRFGENVRRVRERLGLSQNQLAKRLKIPGEKNANISTLEQQSRRVPRRATAQRFAAALSCPASELLLGLTTEFDRLRFPDLDEKQLEGLLAGLALMEKAQREALAEEGRVALLEFLSTAASRPVAQSKLAISEKASRIRRGTK